ncbi:hypothetical protein TWF594_005786 [Orbilia oligospora]|nr:hypothetical protein TWF594_005786 [Orbilia oligospora]
MVHAGGIYVLKNQNTDTVLDENQGNNWVRAWGGNGGDNQKWELNRDGPGHRWWLRNIATGRFLAPEHEDLGAALRTNDEPFLWHISDDEGGHRYVPIYSNLGTLYGITSLTLFDSLQIHHDLDLHIDVKDASRDDDTVVLLWERKGNNQVWILEEA